MTLARLLNLRVALFVTAAVLAAFGIGNAFVAVFVQGKYEVVYSYDVTVRHCASGHCAYSAELSIANMGRKSQDEVVVTIEGLPPNVSGGYQVLNLSAAEPRSGDPAISQQFNSDSATIRLQNLTPGTLVQFRLAGFYPEEKAPVNGQPVLTVTCRGRKIEGDPRAIMLARYIS